MQFRLERHSRRAIAGVLASLALSMAPISFGQTVSSYTADMDWLRLPDGMEWNGSPSWVTPDGKGRVLVFVRAAPYFRLFTTDGRFVRAWGDDEDFGNAHSVTFDAEGNIWATDAANHVAYKYDPQGERLMTLGQAGVAGDNRSHTLFNQVNHVAIGPEGDIYLSDGYGNARVVQYTAAGEFVRIIGGEQGAAQGQLQLPHGVAVDSRGRILVNDSDNGRISVFAGSGEFLETWPFPSRGGIVVTADDTVYVSDVNAGGVNIIRDGELIEFVPVAVRAHGLGVDTDGTIYVSDARDRKVVKLARR